ncbi:MAG: GntP family permease [Dehalobacter sp. 4CP]|nr:GntP family permease [Dehalobacter sp. 4CP]
MGTLLIILAVIIFMYMAYKGYSIILFAPIAALIAALGSGYGLLPVYSELYMAKAAEYLKVYFPVFLLGAVFAKMMEETALAASIASAIIRFAGKKNAVLAAIIGCGILSYGGLSVFVVFFVMYPFAAVLFREAGVPKRLLPATIWVGSFTFAMAALPGSPQIQNILPTAYLGTTTWAAPTIGLFGALIYFIFGWSWIQYRFKKLNFIGEYYGEGHLNEPAPQHNEHLPHCSLSLVPIALVLLVNLYLSNPFDWSWAYHWDENSLLAIQGFHLGMINSSVEKVRSIWSLLLALSSGIICTAFIGIRQLKHTGLLKPLNSGTLASITAALNIASGYAFGSVVTNMPAFQSVKTSLLSFTLGNSPLLSAIVTTDIMVAFSGGASAGITLALDTFGKAWLQMAQTAGIPADVLHRIICIASAGPDSVPHAGSMVTILMISGLTHRESYYDLFILLLINTSVAYICMLFYQLTGLV